MLQRCLIQASAICFYLATVAISEIELSCGRAVLLKSHGTGRARCPHRAVSTNYQIYAFFYNGLAP
jgi:hypothetical protein